MKSLTPEAITSRCVPIFIAGRPLWLSPKSFKDRASEHLVSISSSLPSESVYPLGFSFLICKITDLEDMTSEVYIAGIEHGIFCDSDLGWA